MRVLLTTLNAKYIHTNLAIRILYQLNKHREGIAWKEFTIRQDPRIVADFCAGFDIVCFSCYIWNVTQTLSVVKMLREKNPGTKILLGGPEVTYEYESLFTGHSIDYIIAGEGEVAFSEFLDRYPDVENVPGLVRKEDGQLIVNPSAPAFDVAHLAEVMPYADDVPGELGNKVLYVETSRGCPYKCGFCLASLDNKVRYLPMAAIERTLLFLMEHGRTIKFLDRTFNIKKDFTLAVFRFILAHRRPPNIFQFEITADILHPDIISFIRDEVPRGIFRFEIGIQTVNRDANLAVGRKQDFEKTKQIIAQVRDKVELHLDLIVGLPLDRYADIKRSFREVFALRPPELQLGFLKFLKGTPVRLNHHEHGYVFHDSAPYEIIRSNYLSEEELESVRDLEEALEVYWNGGKATRTLTYVDAVYDIFDFLVALGKTFRKKYSGRQYGINEMYDHLFATAKSTIADEVLNDMIVLDFHLFRSEPSTRYGGVVTPGRKELVAALSFDPFLFEATATIDRGRHRAIIRYDAAKSAEMVPVGASAAAH